MLTPYQSIQLFSTQETFTNKYSVHRISKILESLIHPSKSLADQSLNYPLIFTTLSIKSKAPKL